MKKIGASLLILSLAAVAVAQTNAPAGRALSLQECIAQALQHNFDVRVERFEPVKSMLSLRAAYGGYDPTLSLSATHSHNDEAGLLNRTVGTNFFNSVVGTNVVTSYSVRTNDPGISFKNENDFNSDLSGVLPWGMTYDFNGRLADQTSADNSSGSVGVSVTQPLLRDFWIDNTRLQVAAAKNQVKQTEQGLRNQLINTVTSVEDAFYELIYARDNLNVQQEALTLAETQLHDDRLRVQYGTVAESGGTLEQDEAQVAQKHADLIAAQFAFDQDQNALKNLITDEYAQWHGTNIEPQGTLDAVRQLLDVQDSWSKGMALRPDLLQAKLTLEQQGIQLKYDMNQIFPQLDLKGSYGYNGGGVTSDDTLGQFATANRPFYSYGAQLSMPLSNVKARSNYKADKAVEKQYLLLLKQKEQKAMVDIDNAVKQVQAAWESVAATKQARVYAEAALNAEQKKYAVGKSTTFTVLQLQNNLTAARSQEIRSLADYNKDLAALAQAEGSTLERRNVDVQVK